MAFTGLATQTRKKVKNWLISSKMFLERNSITIFLWIFFLTLNLNLLCYLIVIIVTKGVKHKVRKNIHKKMVILFLSRNILDEINQFFTFLRVCVARPVNAIFFLDPHAVFRREIFLLLLPVNWRHFGT
jgi:hypothetical protein